MKTSSDEECKRPEFTITIEPNTVGVKTQHQVLRRYNPDLAIVLGSFGVKKYAQIFYDALTHEEGS